MSRTLEDLPADIETLIAEALGDTDETPNLERLDAIGAAMERLRGVAVNYRASCGIEQTWGLGEDAYNGVDDLNRSEYSGSRWVKPTSMNVPLTTGDGKTQIDKLRSTVYVRLTTRYVDAGCAKVGEILLDTNGKAFTLEPTPVPDLQEAMGDTSQVEHPELGKLERFARPNELPPSNTPTDPSAPPPTVPATYKDFAEEKQAKAMVSAKKAETRIYDWQVECGHNREMRKVIFDAARIGVGILKGPFPVNYRYVSLAPPPSSPVAQGQKTNSLAIAFTHVIKPADKWVDPWNIFPDPACGENIADGDYLFERDYISEKQLRDLQGLPGYLDNQIERAINIGPGNFKRDGKNPNEPDNRHPFEIWFFHGTMKRDDFETINKSAAEDTDKKKPSVFALVTMVNGIVIRGSLNPLQSGKIPYHSFPWMRRPGFWAGIGVGEQISVPQRIVNSATRSLINNAGISSGPQIVINREGIEPANNEWGITPNKLWYSSKESNMDDIRKTFITFEVPNVTDAMLKIIEYGLRTAEESTNIPLITQGHSGKTTPETLGGAQLQDNNANQVLRRIAITADDCINEPLTHGYHEYLLLDETVPMDEKLNITINAHGSITMVERAIHDQAIAQMTPMAQDPQFGVDPKKWFRVLAKTKHLDPKEVQYTPEEQQKMDSAPKPQAPAIEVAKIRQQTVQMQIEADAKRAQEEDALARELAQLDAQTTTAGEQLRDKTAQLRVKLDVDRDTKFVQAETDRARADYEANIQLLQLKRELAQLDYASKHQMTVDQVKAKLADTSMKIQAQKELAALDAHLTIHQHNTPSGDALVKPVAQLPGKAGNGKAMSQT